MGNMISEDVKPPRDSGRFLAEGFNLDSPEADKEINYGTAAPNWQPKHTQQQRVEDDSSIPVVVRSSSHSESQEVSIRNGEAGTGTASTQQDQQGKNQTIKHRRSSSDSSSTTGGSSTAAEAAAKTTKKQQQPSGNNNGGNIKEQPRKMSYIQMAKMGYQELINAIIRPPRAEYKMEALGPPAFNFCGKRFTRTDFTLRTKRGFNLECSHWEPVERATDRIPVVIYMHGNSSARVEVIPQLSYLLSLGLAVFAFDFAGSGKSDGEYVSLGYFEREDLSCIVAHLRATNVVSTIALWGRSMGAATALMFGDRDPSIACMILDSPFADLTQLCEEMVEKGREQGLFVPNFVVSVAIRVIQGSVKKQAGFNIKRISPISHSDKCFIPALFVAGEHDDFIKKHHSEQLYEKYAGDKNLIVVEGDHNSPRPKFMFDSASIFLQTCLQIPNNWALPVPVSMNLMCPPWYFEIYQQRAARRRQLQQQQQAAMASGAMQNGGLRSSKSSQQGVDAGSGGAIGFECDEMGMTAERQRVIQASLFKMLGQADSGGGSSTNMKGDSMPSFSTTTANESNNTKPQPSSSSSNTLTEIRE